MFDNLSQQFSNLINPSTALGAFIISIVASIVASFIVGRFTAKVTMKQKSKNNYGNMTQSNSFNKK